MIINNTVSDSDDGIHIEEDSQDNLVAYNRITSIGYEGIYVLSSNSNVIVHNQVSFSGHAVPGMTYPGIRLMYSSNTTVGDNTILNCTGGIMTYSKYSDPPASNNTVENNTIESNDYGIILQQEGIARNTNDQISQNTLENNAYGIYLIGVDNNTFYHNNLIGSLIAQATVENCTNIWDDGYPSGGNYWSDYKGADSNHDGIGDTPYIIDKDNIDHYPLMQPWTRIVPKGPGDLNGDGVVDILDVTIAATAYGCVKGDPKWNQLADLAPPYGKINMLDLVTIIFYYGKKYQ
jgi:parallel beta-helix repeat protein